MRRTILALALLAGAAPAMAQMPDMPPPPPGGPGAMLMRADADRDGIVTRDEAAAQADRRFDRLDADHDGTVTRDEMRDARGAMRDRALADGKTPPPPGDRLGRQGGFEGAPGRAPRPAMTRDASRARALAAFDRADANRDGRIDAAEIARMRRGPRSDMPPPPPPRQ